MVPRGPSAASARKSSLELPGADVADVGPGQAVAGRPYDEVQLPGGLQELDEHPRVGADGVGREALVEEDRVAVASADVQAHGPGIDADDACHAVSAAVSAVSSAALR